MDPSRIGNLKTTGLDSDDDNDYEGHSNSSSPDSLEESEAETTSTADQSLKENPSDGTKRSGLEHRQQLLPPNYLLNELLNKPNYNDNQRNNQEEAEPKQQQQSSSSSSSSSNHRKRKINFQPKHIYYHSNSFIKFSESEWDNGVDSADEGGDTWRPAVENSMLQDLSEELSEAERDLMVMWNNFSRSDTIIPAKSIPQKCLTFVEQHATKIKQSNLEDQLYMHFCTLHDDGLLSGDHVASCMEQYHILVAAATARSDERR